MAELGNVFNIFDSGANEEQCVDIEMLDYGFVTDCADKSKLNAILSTLKSGKEGYYPDVSLKTVICDVLADFYFNSLQNSLKTSY